MWYDSEFEMAFQYPDFLPSTYAYAHTSIPSLFSKFITSITQPFESILRFDTLSSTELINAGKILYRLGYKDQIIYDMFVRAGEMGDNNGNVLAAIMKEYGWGVEKNTTNAAEMYFNSLDHVASATTRIGLMFLDPNSPIGYSQEEGASRLDKAGYSGHIDAFLHLSLLFNNRSFVQYNTTRASIYRQNVLLNDGNNGKALYNYALIHQDNSTMVDCQTAVTFMQINLWKTNVYMQLLNELAQRYYKAELFESALNLYQFLSELGFFNAQLNAGLMLESGIGCEHVSKDLRMKKALSLYESAVKVESNNLIWSNLIKNIPGLNGVSYVRLASMYYHGNGINQSMSNAIYWYKMGMKSNNPEAYFMLGFISQYKIDVRDEFTLDSPDNYYTKLMDIRGYSIVGYLMFLNYKVEVNKQPQSGSVNDL
ncbi:Sel1 repeat family protein [Entamoeba marina]